MVKAADHCPSACPTGSGAAVPALRLCQFRSGNSLREPQEKRTPEDHAGAFAQQLSQGPGGTSPQRAASPDPSTEMKPYPLPEMRVRRQRYHLSLVTGQRATLFLTKTKDVVLVSVMCHHGDAGTLGRVSRVDSWAPAAPEGARGPALGSEEPLFAESHLPASAGSEQEPRPQWDLNQACAWGSRRAPPEFSLVTNIFQELTLRCFFFYNTVGESRASSLRRETRHSQAPPLSSRSAQLGPRRAVFLPVTPSQRNLRPSSCPATQDAGEQRAPTCQPAPPRAASLQVLPALGGLQAAATLVHTRSNALALCVSSLHDSGHSLCTRVQACVHMPEAPCTRALRAEDRPQRASPGQRPAAHTFPFNSCSYNLEVA